MLEFILIFVVLFVALQATYVYSMEVLNIMAERKHRSMMLRIRCTEYKPQAANGERALTCLKRDRYALYDAKRIAEIMDKLHSEDAKRIIQLQQMCRCVEKRSIRHIIKKVNTVINRLIRCTKNKLLRFLVRTEARQKIRFIRLKEDVLINEKA